MEDRKISEVLKDFNDGKNLTSELWYDWFCKRSSLKNKTKVLLTRLRRIVDINSKSKHPKFNPDETYVFFKNNWGTWCGLYDDFRICDIKTGDVLFTIVPAHHDDPAEIWGRKDNNEFGKLYEGDWKGVREFFK